MKNTKDIDKIVKKELEEFQEVLMGNNAKYSSKLEFIMHHIKKLEPPHASEIVASYIALTIIEKSMCDAFQEILATKAKGKSTK